MGGALDPDDLQWDPPGPGQWYPSKEHMPRPMTGLLCELLPLASRGWQLGAERYGLPPNNGTFGTVNRWGYYSPGQRGDVDLDALEATAAESLATKRWRRDLDRWRDEWRPAITATSRTLLGVDLPSLSDDELAEHVQQALDHFAANAPEHFAAMPRGSAALGALLLAGDGWGFDRRQVLEALAGCGAASSSAERLFDQIAEAVRRAGAGVPERLEDIRAAGPEAAALLDELLLEHAWRCFGVDLVGPTLAERPEAIVAAVAAALTGWAERHRPDGTALDALRARVPTADLARFDELLEDARIGYGDNDDNSVVLFSHPLGIVRRAVVEVGRRLAERGLVEQVEDALEARSVELLDLVRGHGGPTAEELAARRRFREQVADVDPPVVGTPLPPGPPVELPPSVRQLEALMDAFRSVAWAPADTTERAAATVGTEVVRGRAVVADDPVDALERLEPGDVLVALTTSAPYNTIFPLAGAVAVQVGGFMDHAAVLARELGVPAVIGVPDLLERVHDGDLVEVDPVAGTIRVVDPG